MRNGAMMTQEGNKMEWKLCAAFGTEKVEKLRMSSIRFIIFSFDLPFSFAFQPVEAEIMF